MVRPFGQVVGMVLLACLALGCGASVLRLGPESAAKFDTGEEIVVIRTDGSAVRGRIEYRDSEVVVLRTKRRSVRSDPVRVDRFTERIAWRDIESVRIRGVLDGYGEAISEQKIRGNMGKESRWNWGLSMGLLGSAAGFVLGVHFYDISDEKDQSILPFWPIWAGGTAIGGLGGYAIGRFRDRSRAIEEIRHRRSGLTDTR